MSQALVPVNYWCRLCMFMGLLLVCSTLTFFYVSGPGSSSAVLILDFAGSSQLLAEVVTVLNNASITASVNIDRLSFVNVSC
jgi:hypothetical protein